jgi:hypothetical protein
MLPYCLAPLTFSAVATGTAALTSSVVTGNTASGTGVGTITGCSG